MLPNRNDTEREYRPPKYQYSNEYILPSIRLECVHLMHPNIFNPIRVHNIKLLQPVEKVEVVILTKTTSP